MDQENVLDETYRKAGKMDSGCFAPRQDPVHSNLLWENIRTNLLEGTQSKKNIKTELYKLNVYGMYLIDIHLHLILRCCPGKGSFFKPHVDTPRSEKMFGSLVMVFPTPHEGGALLLRHRGQEWVFDSGKSLAAEREPSIGFVAFFSDIEHEVAPVISGHRITLTYNLYFDDGGPVSPNIEHLTHPQLENEVAFRKVFKGLLENPEFLADGGTLAFGLRHVYPIENNLEQVYSVLKGGDAVVSHNAALYLPYACKNPCENKPMVSEKPMWAHFECSLIVLHGPNNNLTRYVCGPRRASKRFFQCHRVGRESQPGDTPDALEWARNVSWETLPMSLSGPRNNAKGCFPMPLNGPRNNAQECFRFYWMGPEIMPRNASDCIGWARKVH
jgi:hypothetical protein